MLSRSILIRAEPPRLISKRTFLGNRNCPWGLIAVALDVRRNLEASRPGSSNATMPLLSVT